MLPSESFFSVFFSSWAERKCGLFRPPLPRLALPEPRPSAWGLLSTVMNLHRLRTSREQQQQQQLGLLCRCEQCEYDSATYQDGQKFSSDGDPCVQCRCSVGLASARPAASALDALFTPQFSPSGGPSDLRARRRHVSRPRVQPPGPAEGRVLSHLPQSVPRRPRQFLSDGGSRKNLSAPLSLQTASSSRRCTPTGKPSCLPGADPV